MKVLLKEIMLLKDFEGASRFAFWRKKKKRKKKNNEVYLRCICWIDPDFEHAQYYPKQEIIKNENQFLLNEPYFFMRPNQSIIFGQIISYG